MNSTKIRRAAGFAALALTLWASQAPVWAQPRRVETPQKHTLDEAQPDARELKDRLSEIMKLYPPTLKTVLANDPSLLSRADYMAPYPALVEFLSQHPEIARNPAYYLDAYESLSNQRPDWQNPEYQAMRMSQDIFQALAVIVGFGMGIGLLVWLIKTFIDARRWNRMAKVQTEVHTKLLDRFTGNEDLMAYIQSPAGSKFLESSPIRIDPAPKGIGAPTGRILLALQAGVVLAALGIGLLVASGLVSQYATPPLRVLGTLGIALGIGFAVSAAVSYFVSSKLGLIDQPTHVEPADRS